jgi:hypothetical protein
MLEREIEETIQIVASPSEVWWHLTNFQAYPEWNPFITRVEGDLREGGRLNVTVDPHLMPSFAYRPKIIVAEAERELCWRGRPGVPNLFDGEHAFVIETTGIDRVCFRQRETFSGVFAPGTVSLIEGRLRESFRRMNAALRQRAEAGHAARQSAQAERQSSS